MVSPHKTCRHDTSPRPTLGVHIHGVLPVAHRYQPYSHHPLSTPSPLHSLCKACQRDVPDCNRTKQTPPTLTQAAMPPNRSVPCTWPPQPCICAITRTQPLSCTCAEPPQRAIYCTHAAVRADLPVQANSTGAQDPCTACFAHQTMPPATAVLFLPPGENQRNRSAKATPVMHTILQSTWTPSHTPAHHPDHLISSNTTCGAQPAAMLTDTLAPLPSHLLPP